MTIYNQQVASLEWHIDNIEISDIICIYADIDGILKIVSPTIEESVGYTSIYFSTPRKGYVELRDTAHSFETRQIYKQLDFGGRYNDISALGDIRD